MVHQGTSVCNNGSDVIRKTRVGKRYTSMHEGHEIQRDARTKTQETCCVVNLTHVQASRNDRTARVVVQHTVKHRHKSELSAESGGSRRCCAMLDTFGKRGTQQRTADDDTFDADGRWRDEHPSTST